MGICASCRRKGCQHSRENLGGCNMYWPKPMVSVRKAFMSASEVWGEQKAEKKEAKVFTKAFKKKKGKKKKSFVDDKKITTTINAVPEPSAVIDFMAGTKGDDD